MIFSEAEMLKSIKHSNIVKIVNTFTLKNL